MLKPIQTSIEEVFSRLEAWGAPGTGLVITSLAEPGKLRVLAKKLKTNHPLAIQLWSTGNADARILATMLMSTDQLSKREVEEMLAPLTYYKLVDEFVYNASVKTTFADAMRQIWVDSPEEFIGRAGWDLCIARNQANAMDGLDFDVLLYKIEAGMKSAPQRKQESMNHCLCEIGIRFPEYIQRCIKIGERLGRLDSTPVPIGCTSSCAPEWITATINRVR